MPHLSSTTQNLSQLSEMNHVAALLRRNGYSFSDHGTSVVVSDPVHSSVGGHLVLCGTEPVVLSTAAQARRFVDERR